MESSEENAELVPEKKKKKLLYLTVFYMIYQPVIGYRNMVFLTASTFPFGNAK